MTGLAVAMLASVLITSRLAYVARRSIRWAADEIEADAFLAELEATR